SHGSIPACWKKVTVIPILKKGAASEVKNYRPITLSNSCSKIFESVLKLKLLAYLKDNNFITPEQHGFLQGHSTCTNLIESMNDWTNCLDKSIETLVLYVDFAKAFDCVSVSKQIGRASCRE